MTEIAGSLRGWVLRIAALTARWLPQDAKRWLYRLGPLTRALRSTLNRAAPTGWTDVRVAAGELSGMWLSLDLQSEKDYWLGTYEPDLQATVRDVVRPGMTVYDLGANIGYLTLLFATVVGTEGRVVAFEPLPSNLERLKAHVARNSLGLARDHRAGSGRRPAGPAALPCAGLGRDGETRGRGRTPRAGRALHRGADD